MAFDIYQEHHPLMRRTDTIDIIGYNGDRCRISGKGARDDWGPLLAPASTGLWDAPFKTNWGPGMFGQRYVSWSPQRRDAVFTVHIMNPQTGLPAVDANPDLWHTIYSRWRAMWSKKYESTVVYTSIDGERRLGMRLLQNMQPFSSQPFEGKDPHLFPYGSIVMPTACEIPYYVGESYAYAYEFNGTGNHWFRIPFFNPSTVEIWPEYWGTDQCAWMLPDWSWGNEEYGRGIPDEGKTVRVPGVKDSYLKVGASFHAVTRPDEETFRTENDVPLGNLMNGTDFEYPIQPGAGEAPEFDTLGNCTNGATVQILNCTNPEGARLEVELPRWYDEPFSSPRVF